MEDCPPTSAMQSSLLHNLPPPSLYIHDAQTCAQCLNEADCSLDGPEPTLDYLNQLLRDRYDLEALISQSKTAVFYHLVRLTDEEVDRTRKVVFKLPIDDSVCDFPAFSEPRGATVTLTRKIQLNVDNALVGRILGPRGSTVKQLEEQTGCKILVCGRRSKEHLLQHRDVTRDPVIRELNRADEFWKKFSVDSGSFTGQENALKPFYVVVSTTDTETRAHAKIAAAERKIKHILESGANSDLDDFKRRQLIELAIINGTYRYPLVSPRCRPHPDAISINYSVEPKGDGFEVVPQVVPLVLSRPISNTTPPTVPCERIAAVKLTNSNPNQEHPSAESRSYTPS